MGFQSEIHYRPALRFPYEHNSPCITATYVSCGTLGGDRSRVHTIVPAGHDLCCSAFPLTIFAALPIYRTKLVRYVRRVRITSPRASSECAPLSLSRFTTNPGSNSETTHSKRRQALYGPAECGKCAATISSREKHRHASTEQNHRLRDRSPGSHGQVQRSPGGWPCRCAPLLA